MKAKAKITRLARRRTPEEVYLYAYDKGMRIMQDEDIVAQSAEWSVCYARDVVGARFEKGEATIARSAKWSYAYARTVLGGRFLAGEKIIAHEASWAYEYARYVIKGAFPEAESVIGADAAYAVMYAQHVLRGPFTQGEDAIARSANAAMQYAAFVLQRPFHKGEPTIRRAAYIRGEYDRLYKSHHAPMAKDAHPRPKSKSARRRYPRNVPLMDVQTYHIFRAKRARQRGEYVPAHIVSEMLAQVYGADALEYA